MNPVLIQSWYFFKNNAQELCLFILPVFALSMIVGVLGMVEPESSLLSVLGVVQLMVGQLFTAGLLLLISNISNGNHPPHKEILTQAIPFLMTITLVAMLTLVAIWAGLLFMIIPGIWLFLRLFLAPLYVVFQNKSVLDAIKTAFVDSKEHFRPFFQTLIPFMVLGLVLVLLVVEPPGTEREPQGLLMMTVTNLAISAAFVFASILQYRLYTVYIVNQSDDDEERVADED